MRMNSQVTNFGFLISNSTYLESLRSSRTSKGTAMRISTKEAGEGLQTLKKFFNTPEKPVQIHNIEKSGISGNDSINNESKVHFNQNIFLNFTESGKQESANKENSNIRSNLRFSSEEKAIEDDESFGSNTSNAFKAPIMKKDANDPSFLQTVTVNLQTRLNCENPNEKDKKGTLFGKSIADGYLHKTLISSSSNSSSSNGDFQMNSSNSSLICDKATENKMLYSSEGNCPSQCQIQVIDEHHSPNNKVTFEHRPSICIPIEKANDENYKLLAIKKIRKPIFKDNKSTSKYENLNGISQPTNPFLKNFERIPKTSNNIPESIFEYNLLNEKRKKVAHSVKRIYASEIPFYDSFTRKQKNFYIYKDNEIGIHSEWQKFIHEVREDEDIPSDDEMQANAGNHMRSELHKAIILVKSEGGIQYIHNKQFL